MIKLKIWYYKWRSRVAYKNYINESDIYGCGSFLAEYISVNISTYKKRVEYYIEKVKSLEAIAKAEGEK